MRLISLLVFTSIFLLLSCAKDSDSNEMPGDNMDDNGTFSATINGASFPSGDNQAYGVTFDSATDYETIFIDFRAEVNNGMGELVVLSFSKILTGPIEEGDEFNSVVFDSNDSSTYQYVVAGYERKTAQGNSTINSASTLKPGEAYVKITKLDKENAKISGEFYFNALDENTNENFEVINGTFTDLEF
jgi:hypothetical protein